MNWLRSFILGIPDLFRKNRLDRELTQELEFHIEMEVEENLRRGLSPEEARRQAKIDLGGMEQIREECREARGFAWLDSLWRDLKYTLRSLKRNPSFTVTTLLTLGLGIGANVAAFSVVYAVVFKPLPYETPKRLVAFEFFDRENRDRWHQFQISDWELLKEETGLFDSIAYFWPIRWIYNVSGEGFSKKMAAQYVSWELFRMLGVDPVVGRHFTAEEDQPDAEPAVILSYKAWQRYFGGKAEALGKRIRFINNDDDSVGTIIGVMPPGFYIWDSRADFWLSYRFAPSRQQGYQTDALGRLKPGVSFDEVQPVLDTVSSHLAESDPERHEGLGIRLLSANAKYVGRFRSTVLALWVVAILVLLVTAANVSGLMLARAHSREKETATRLALGCGRWRLARLYLIEGQLLSFLAVPLAALLASWLVWLVLRLNPDSDPMQVWLYYPRLDEAAIDERALLYALVLALLIGGVIGCVAALRAVSGGKLETLTRAQQTSSIGPPRQWFRNVLVASQIAVTFVLLVAGGLLIQSYLRVLAVDPGFNPDQVLTFRVEVNRADYSENVQLKGEAVQRRSHACHRLYLRILDGLKAVAPESRPARRAPGRPSRSCR